MCKELTRMIAGIGVDIAEVNRIQEKIERTDTFKQHVFSENEITYCEKQKFPFVHFAARWAVKEAYLKAFGLKYIGNPRLPEIGTMHQVNGTTYVHLLGKALEEHAEKKLGIIHLSISHTKEIVIAYVIIEAILE